MIWIKRALWLVVGFFALIIVLGTLLQWLGFEPEPRTAPATGAGASAESSSNDAPRPRVGRNERHVRRADYGADWPLTVEEGILRCEMDRGRPIAQFVLREKRIHYALNGAAMAVGFPEPDTIRRAQTWAFDTPVARLALGARRDIFSASVTCEDVGNKRAELLGGTVQQQASNARTHIDDCKATLWRSSGITEEEARRISQEGIAHSWPPLSPTFVSLGPLTRDALALCPAQ